jgi:hypothetical protein
VVPGGFERVGQPGQHAGAGVLDERRLAVHQLRRPHHRPAEGVADGLVAEAHPQDRATAGEGVE